MPCIEISIINHVEGIIRRIEMQHLPGLGLLEPTQDLDSLHHPDVGGEGGNRANDREATFPVGWHFRVETGEAGGPASAVSRAAIQL